MFSLISNLTYGVRYIIYFVQQQWTKCLIGDPFRWLFTIHFHYYYYKYFEMAANTLVIGFGRQMNVVYHRPLVLVCVRGWHFSTEGRKLWRQCFLSACSMSSTDSRLWWKVSYGLTKARVRGGKTRIKHYTPWAVWPRTYLITVHQAQRQRGHGGEEGEK